jgi:acyl carrier protein
MSRREIEELVKRAVATSFGVPPDELTESTSAEDVDGWDSLAHASLVLRISRMCSVKLPERAAFAAQNIGELIDLVVQHRGAANA